MLILCPAELAKAARFAEEIDKKAASLAAEGRSPDWKRGRATASLLACLAGRAEAEAAANASLRFGPDTMVETDSVCRKTSALRVADLPRLEVRIAADFADYSFFFSEAWVDPGTGAQVKVLDPLWYVFDRPVAVDVSGMTADELDSAVLAGTCRPTYDEKAAAKAESDGCAVRRVMHRRRGLTGGLICHMEYGADGEQTGLCYWTTHT